MLARCVRNIRDCHSICCVVVILTAIILLSYRTTATLTVSATNSPMTCPKNTPRADSRPSIFTKIIRRQAPATILYEDELVIAFLGLNKVVPIQFLVVPKKQLATLEEAEACDEQILGHMMLVASKVAKKEGIKHGYRLVINNGPDALQAVPHLHMHVFGGQSMDWPPGTGAENPGS